MMFFSEFLASTVLFLIGFRILFSYLDDLSDKKVLQTGAMTKIVAACVMLTTYVVIFSENRALLSLFFISALPASVASYVHLQKKLLSGRLEQSILPIVDRILLFMKSGSSLPDALNKSLTGLDENISARFRLILRQEARPNEHFNSRNLKKFSQLYQFLSENKHQCLPLLTQFRSVLHVEQGFQNRMRQAMANIYAQIIVITSLYIGALAVQIRWNNLIKIQTCIFISLILFLLGIGALFILLRSFKWTA